MKNYGLLIALLLLSIGLFGQEPPAPVQEEASPAPLVEIEAEFNFQPFPGGYLGVWEGELKIYAADGLKQSVPMELDISPIDDSTFTYTIIYGEDREAGKRDYLLRKGKEGSNHWVIDEQDGILLDNFYVGGILHGPFIVMGSQLYSQLERRGMHLHYSIASGSSKSFRESGTTTEVKGEEQRIDVEAFKIGSYQMAVLKRRE
ncbi:hypothetical protein CEQ90_12860 [Lewinellaceae bacterium SD302]|nr:hypothetical protein CEQ90_12860 [Lewinellaceae bacterium SD302]